MIEYHIGKYLTDRGVLTMGTNATVRFEPDTDNVTATIISESAPQQDFSHHFDTSFIGIQFIVKALNGNQAEKLASSINNTLKALGSLEITGVTDSQNVALPDIYVVDTLIVNEPVFLGYDEKGRSKFTSHYMIESERDTYLWAKQFQTLSPIT